MKLFAALVAGVLILAAGSAMGQPVKVGVVNVIRLESESLTATRALKSLAEELKPRGEEIKAFQEKVESERRRFDADRVTLSGAAAEARSREISEMMRRSNQMVEALAETQELRRREIRARVVEEARAAIKVVAEAGKYDLVLMDAVFARSGVDITPQVLKEMNRRTGAR